MRKIILILAALIFSTVAYSQKKEKIKGSKIVTIQQKEIKDFNGIEINDNLEISLIKGDRCGVEIEADDNLHDVVNISFKDNLMRMTTLRNVSSAKKFLIRITYTTDLKIVVTKNDAVVNALAEINLDEITFNSYDNSKLFLNARTKNFILKQDDKSKVELNLKSENAVIELSKNSHLKALINALNVKCDLYQKADAEIEGVVMEMKLRLDNNSDFIGKKLIVKNMELTTELYANCDVNVNTILKITASGNSEIEIYGEPKIDLIKFSDNAKLIKKPMK